MNFPPRFLDELRDRVSITSVVGRKVKLQRRGREQTGLCPFHAEKTPSFTVSDDKGFYHCFGCGAHGDAISFLTQSEGLSFPEAVERLAAEAGMALPQPDRQAEERQKRAADLQHVLEAATVYFEKQLRMPDGSAALDYLHERGLDDAAIARHRLGFAPEHRGAMAAALGRDGVESAQLVAAGLLKRAEDSDSLYEYFRGRVIFPIADRRGRPIAFGGRALADAKPKYLNSPETAVFRKGHTLYNLSRAREAAHRSGELIVVEGYMDVIGLDRAGLPNAVAPLGTALTEDQIRELWRVVPEPVLCFDGDKAGWRAAARAAERALPILEPRKSLYFAALPPGEDPDSLVRSQGAGAFRDLLDRREPLVDVIWRMLVMEHNADTPERRAGLRKDVAEKLRTIGDRSVRQRYVEEFRKRLEAVYADTARPAEGMSRRSFVPRARAQAFSPPVPGHSARLGQMRNLSDSMRRTTLNRLLSAIVNFPELLSEYAEFFAELELPEQLDTLRDEILTIYAQERELDGKTLVSHLTRAGNGALALLYLSREDGGSMANWLRFADIEEARAILGHVSAQWQRKLIERDMRERLDQVSDDAAEQELEFFVAVSTLEQGRTTGDSGT